MCSCQMIDFLMGFRIGKYNISVLIFVYFLGVFVFNSNEIGKTLASDFLLYQLLDPFLKPKQNKSVVN